MRLAAAARRFALDPSSMRDSFVREGPTHIVDAIMGGEPSQDLLSSARRLL